MIKVLVVDDEELIREKIVYLLNNSSISFASIAEAGNGQEALERISAGDVPDLVLTDVRMPVMNGLELIESIRGLHPEVRFIVVSGYAEFEYAVRAMQYGVTNYLLKPVKEQELIAVVGQMRDEIAQARQEKDAMKHSETMKLENRRLVVEKTLYRLLNDRQEDGDLRRSLEQERGILGHSAYSVSAVKLHPYPQRDLQAVYSALHQEFDGQSDHSWMMENFFGEHTLIVLFGGRDHDALAETASRQTSKLHQQLTGRYGLAATVGMSNVCGDLRTAYRNSLNALKKRFLQGTGRIYAYKTDVVHKDRASQSFVFKVKLAEKSLENKGLSKVKGILLQFAEEIFVRDIADYLGETTIDYLFNEYINIIIRFCLKNKVSFLEQMEPDVISGKVLEGLDDNSALLDLIGTTVERIFELPVSDGSDQRSGSALQMSVVDNIIQYIHRNIHEEITLQTISEKFAINPSYLSRVFKAANEQGFVKYVTGLKIAKARELLDNGNADIASIAHGLGFSDQQYFNRVFKKLTGMTPNEARSQGKKSPKIT